MPLLHVSLNALDPERVARFLAAVLGGEAMPFPPFPACWIAFTRSDDGTAIEVYPTTHRLIPGEAVVACLVDEPDNTPTYAHAAIGTPLTAAEVSALADAEGWPLRRCNRGPFECLEVWVESRSLIEVLDAGMQADYRAGMTMAGWGRMFGDLEL